MSRLEAVPYVYSRSLMDAQRTGLWGPRPPGGTGQVGRALSREQSRGPGRCGHKQGPDPAHLCGRRPLPFGRCLPSPSPSASPQGRGLRWGLPGAPRRTVCSARPPRDTGRNGERKWVRQRSQLALRETQNRPSPPGQVPCAHGPAAPSPVHTALQPPPLGTRPCSLHPRIDLLHEPSWVSPVHTAPAQQTPELEPCTMLSCILYNVYVIQ